MSSEAAAVSGPVRPAHAFDPAPVSAFLRERIAGFALPMEIEQFSGGQSNPTFLLTTPGARYVLRRKPSGPTLRTAHAVDREFRITTALHRQGLPVARPLAFCDDPAVMDTPFFVMEYVDGRIFWNPLLPGLSRDERSAIYASLADALAQVHAVPIDASGLADYGKRGNYFGRQIARWTEQYVAATTRDIPEMDHLIAWLRERPPATSGRESVIHGDFRLDNVIFARDTPAVRAVIDWELSTLGDPMADLSYQCMLWHLPAGVFGSLAGADLAALGIPSEAAYMERYFARAGGTRPADWESSIVYNLFRLASILQGVARRAIDGNASSQRATQMAQLVQPIAERAWQLARTL